LLRTGRGLLLTTDDTAAHTARHHTDRVDIVTGTPADTPGTTPGAVPDTVLVRPDGYVAWTAPGTTDDLDQALERWFGAARTAL
ncbi:aromatic-ring hydroxylase C-terminal domain-containing protein, partial [Streptomyces sp. NPDC001758]